MLPQLGEKFEITGRHAGGATCEVFKAHHVALDLAVAVKVLKSQHAGDPHFAERMRIEAQVLPRLKSRHIVQCFDRGITADGRPYTVLEFLRGETLDAIVERLGPFHEHAVIELGAALLDALAVTHARGIVHRDVSLRNLIVHHTEHEAPTLKLIDFGFALVLPSAPPSAPEPADAPECEVVGTPRFTSPELARGEHDIDARSDLYSAGAVLYTLLAGRDPFGDLRDANDILDAQAHDRVPPLSLYAPRVSSGTAAVVMRLLEKEPGRRFESAADARSALVAAETALQARQTNPTETLRDLSISSAGAHCGRAIVSPSRSAVSVDTRQRGRNLVSRIVGKTLVLRQNRTPPDDSEWQECLELLARLQSTKPRPGVLVISEGGAPTVPQCEALRRLLQGRALPVAVVMDSIPARFVSAAVILMNRKHKTFSVRELGRAYAYVGLTGAPLRAVEKAVAEMAEQLDGSSQHRERSALA